MARRSGGPSSGDDELDATARGRKRVEISMRDERAAPDRLLQSLRGGSGRAPRRRSRRAPQRARRRARSRRRGATRCVAPSAAAAAANPSWWRTRGSRSSQSAAGRARRPVRASRPRETTSDARSVSPAARSARPASSICAIAASCCTGPSWSSSTRRRRSSCSARIRSARSARSGSSVVNRSSRRGARSRPRACACRPRASRGCGARGSSRSPG